MRQLIFAALFAAILVFAAGEEHHKKCCGSCRSSYPHAHHLKHSCLRGCRLYSMIYLAHDKSIPDAELSTMCSKSCQNGFSGMLGGADGSKACLTGCQAQEQVFKEHGLDDHGAKLSVMHGLGVAPEMHSPMPIHHRIFQQMRDMHQRMLQAMSGVKHAVIQRIQIRIHSLPPGPDGKPRYQVEIQQHRVPFVFGHPFGNGPLTAKPKAGGGMPERPLIGAGDHDKKSHHGSGDHHHGDHHHGDHHGGPRMSDDDHHDGHRHHHEHGRPTVAYRVRHFFADMSEPAKTALRWFLFGMLFASVTVLVWLCFRTCRRALAASSAASPGHLEKPHVSSLTKAFIKKKPGVQSGDIFYVDVSSDKKPLIEDDCLQDSKKEDA